MKIFFISFNVVPATYNEHYNMIESGISYCWSAGYDAQSTLLKAQFYISKNNWEILNIEHAPIEVNEDHLISFCDLLESDFELSQIVIQNTKSLKEGFSKDGIAFFYKLFAKNEQITKPTILFSSLPPKQKTSDFINKQRELDKKENGRCLHYDTGNECDFIINAHSIQKNQALSSIAENGEVYAVAGNFGDLAKNGEKIGYKKVGINKFSTFSGFCHYHDSKLFKPIDDFQLTPTNQQVFLYAYRSLCRAFFVKENSLELINYQIKRYDNKAVSTLLNSHKKLTVFGLHNLKRHKLEYDNSLRENVYSDIKYTLFISNQKPCIFFSGLFYPDFDFMGRQLQNLGDCNIDLDLMTICSAPMIGNKWGFLFAWHKNSSKICNEFMRSLAKLIYDNHDTGDLLFRLAISNCENLAISPQWWKKLSDAHKEKISLRVSEMAIPDIEIKYDYLIQGLEGVSQWQFDEALVHK